MGGADGRHLFEGGRGGEITDRLRDDMRAWWHLSGGWKITVM